MFKLLFLCVANSSRSQLAEGLAREIFGELAEIQSAGSHPGGRVNPYVLKILEERGLDTSMMTSKTWDSLDRLFLKNLDCVITLCSEEYCPKISEKTKHLHWPVENPSTPEAYEKLTESLILKLKQLKKELQKTK